MIELSEKNKMDELIWIGKIKNNNKGKEILLVKDIGLANQYF